MIDNLESEPDGGPWPVEPLVAWASGYFAEHGLEGGAPHVIRAMPWATVVRWNVAPSGVASEAQRVVWGKAMCPGFASEVALLPLLAGRYPAGVLSPLAADAARGLLLLPDGGPTMADVHAAGMGESAPEPVRARAVEAWAEALAGYARLQRAMVGRDVDLLATGVVDLRPNRAVEALAALGQRPDLHRVGQPGGLTDAEVGRLRALVDVAADVASRLESGGVPASIQHDDLQPSNVLLDGRLLDWGDASLAHPFGSLLTALSGISGRPGTPVDRSAIRDRYLTAWLDGVVPDSERALDWAREQARLAVLLALVGRILAWLRAPESALELYPDAVTSWLRRIVHARWPDRR